MRKLLSFLLACIHALPLTAETIRLTAETESLASAYGCVNAVSGDFFDFQTDVVCGVESLNYTRCYDSGHPYSSRKGYGMGSQFPFYMGTTTLNLKSQKVTLPVMEREGSYIPYLREFRDGVAYFTVDPELFKHGYTNYSEDGINASTDIRNRIIKCLPDKSMEVTEGSGLKRLYRPFRLFEKGVQYWQLVKEIRPNGQKLLFYYEDLVPKRITATNHAETTAYGWMEFDYDPAGYTLTTNDSQRVRYNTTPVLTYHKTGGGSHKVESWITENHLTELVNSRGIDITYEICASHKEGLSRQITRICKPEGRYLSISYGKGDKAGKVLGLYAPLGGGTDPILQAAFSYPHANTTEVRDAYGTKTIYRSDNERIVAVERYTKSDALYSARKYLWQNHRLAVRANVDSQNRCIESVAVTYDDRGNIIREDLHGNLTGHSQETFAIDANLCPIEPTECYSTLLTYSQDGFNLPLVERHPDGKEVRYTYQPGTNLCVATFVCQGNRILSRQFHSYEDGLLTMTISDDGSSEDRDDLTDVHVRTMNCVQRRACSPAIGFPEKIIESYCDLETGQSKQLKALVKHFNECEQVIREDIYDADDQFSHSLHYSYDEKGNLIAKTDPIGRQTLYNYDLNKNKTKEEVVGSGITLVYTYDTCDRLIKESQYHSDSSILSTVHAYDWLGNRTSTTDHFGNRTQYKYDEFGRQTQVIYPPCQGVEGHIYSSTLANTYDITGNVIEQRDGLGNPTFTRYNCRNQPILITYPDGTQERLRYNLNGTLAEKWNRNQLHTRYIYDGLQRLVQTEEYDVSGNLLRTLYQVYSGANLVRTIDAMGYATEYCYDGAGRKIEERHHDGARTTYEYDSMGRLSATSRWVDAQAFIRTVDVFDNLDRVVEQRVEDHTGNVLRQERYAYDLHGNKTITEVSINENTSSTTETNFDTRGRPLWTKDALGNLTTFHNFERHGNPLTSGAYVFRKTTTDPLKRETIEVYDAQGRISSIERRSSSGQHLAHQTLLYDAAGRSIRQHNLIFHDGQQKGHYTIDWTYNSMGQLLSLCESASDGKAKTTFHSYDAFGRLQTITKPDGVILSHTYDAFDRLSSLESSDHTVFYVYSYDANHNVMSVVDKVNHTTTYREYDESNRLVQEVLANGLAMAYQHDELGRIVHVTLPDATGIDYSYQGVDLSCVSRTDYAGTSLYSHEYHAYDWRGRDHTRRLIGNAGTMALSYDVLGRPLSILAPHWSEIISPDGYDQVGNLLEVRVEDSLGTMSTHYQYDDLDQLIGEGGQDPHHYAYDSIHNRLSKDNHAYHLNGLNQVLDDSQASYSYDLCGNLISKAIPLHTISYSYDALNRLTQAECHGQWVISYSYDSFGRRLTRHLSYPDGSQEYSSYLFQGMCEIGCYKNDHLQELRILGKGKGAELGAAIAIEVAGDIYAPIHDHRGNVCCLLSTSGVAEDTYRYTAYGESTNDTATVNNPWRYASKRLDHLTGLYNFCKRDYDCQLGRWLTPDPAGFVDGPNLYAYVSNRPLTLFDPWGLRGQSSYDRNKSSTKSSTRNKTSSNRSSGPTIRPKVFTAVASVGHHLLPFHGLQKGWMHGCSKAGGFEVDEDYLKHSQSIVIPRTNPNNLDAVALVNGVNTSFAYCMKRALEIQKACDGVAVVICYVADKGLFRDFSECGANMLSFETHAQIAVKAGIDVAIQLARDQGGGVFPLLHSRAGLSSEPALNSYDSNIAKMMYPVTCGSAKIIEGDQFGGYANLAHCSDGISALTGGLRYMQARIGNDPGYKFIGSYTDAFPGCAHSFETYYLDHAVREVNFMRDKHMKSGAHW
ncbi:MAG: RHS repeat-associated core domain-containing protein [Chlamydiales bacterium]|nr:RHS repeat-associated core domain-containing protein [Chlamydiales bacterium]